MSLFGVILVRIFPAFPRIRIEYSVQMRENGENEDQNNSEYGHFLRSVSLLSILYYWSFFSWHFSSFI